jgi:hypothetical protein
MLALAVILIIVGAVPCLIGVIFLSYELKRRRTAALMRRVPTSPASAVAGMQPGQVVEVTGTLRCKKPLRSELAGFPCAYYESRVERTFEHDERDDNDNVITVERTETLGSNARSVPFFVEDASGQVRVIPDGAGIDARLVFDQVEDGPWRSPVKLGGKRNDRDYGIRNIGYRTIEEILAVDAPVYVLGVVTPDGSIGRPDDGARDAELIISYRSEEAIAGSHQGDRLFLWCGAGALAVGGLLVAIGIGVGAIWAL